MDVTTIAISRFDAAHQTDAEPCNLYDHGHSWTVRVEVKGQLDPKTGRARGSVGLESAVVHLLLELDGRDLEAMMPGASTTPVGVAAWIMERLSLGFPRITAVEVLMGHLLAGRVDRQIRE